MHFDFAVVTAVIHKFAVVSPIFVAKFIGGVETTIWAYLFFF